MRTQLVSTVAGVMAAAQRLDMQGPEPLFGGATTASQQRCTAHALLAYLGDRERHPLANDADLWLGNRGTQLSYDGLVRGLRGRAAVKDFRGRGATEPSAAPAESA